MSNQHRGEVEFTLNKKVHTLHFSTNAMCELENAFGDGVLQIAQKMSDTAHLKISDLRTIFWAGLRDYHEAITPNEAGKLMDGIGLAKASELIAKAFTQSFPEAAVPLDKGQPGEAPNSTGQTH